MYIYGFEGQKVTLCTQDKISKFKLLADNNYKLARMMECIFDIVENNAGKGENAGLPAFSSFSLMLFKRVFLKSGLCGKQLRYRLGDKENSNIFSLRMVRCSMGTSQILGTCPSITVVNRPMVP